MQATCYSEQPVIPNNLSGQKARQAKQRVIPAKAGIQFSSDANVN